MANEYATRTELKAYLGIGNTDQDDTLDIILEAASRAVDDYCDRHFYAESDASARTYTAEGRFVFVDDISETDSLVVKGDPGYDGTYEQTWTKDDYSGGFGFRLFPYNALDQSEPAERLEAITSFWPSRRAAVQVTAKWGWPAVPAAVKQATLAQARYLWQPSGQLEATSGSPNVESVDLEGAGGVNYSSVTDLTSVELDVSAKGLLRRYRKWRLL